jgi:hypothetical protein
MLLDVLECGRASFETDGVANDKSSSFGFRLGDSPQGVCSAIAAVEELMREFVRQCRELFSRRLAEKQRDTAATRYAARRRDFA